MCMLSYIPPNVQPDAAELFNGADQNPDGHGWAIVDAARKVISIQKFMNADQAVETFIAARKSNATGPALFHSRIATSGLVDITGVHPFRVGDDNRTVVGHNGILFHPAKGSRRSDTRIFAEDVMPLRFANLDRSKTMRKLQRYCGYGNKLVILTVNPLRQRHGYIVNEKAGYWSGKSGAWHSNADYMGWPIRAHGVTSYSYAWDGASESAPWDRTPDPGLSPWPCGVCRSYNSVDKFTMICEICGCCNDCQQHEYDCMCYIPADDKHAALLAAIDR